jgi:small GTP-binding protein
MRMAIIKKKMVLLGDGAVGKTSLIRKFVTDKYDDDYIVTIGTKVTKKDLVVGGKELTLMIWDVLGQQGYTTTQSMSFSGSTGAMLVADITRSETLDSLTNYWIPTLTEVTGPIPLIFLANKADLKDQYQFDEAGLEALAKSYGASHLLTSAKSGMNVEKAFKVMGQTILTGKAPTMARPTTKTVKVKSVPTLIKATDRIIEDFVAVFGDREQAMPIIRQQFATVGIDVRSPTRAGLKQVVKRLENVEKDLKSEEIARKNRVRRYKIIKSIE